MPKFVLLIKGEGKYDQLSPAEMEGVMAKYFAFSQRLRDEGRLVDADGLERASKLITSSNGSITVTDGPFAETKDLVGGYYNFTAADFDEAVKIASDCPSLQYGGDVELRKVMDYS